PSFDRIVLYSSSIMSLIRQSESNCSETYHTSVQISSQENRQLPKIWLRISWDLPVEIIPDNWNCYWKNNQLIYSHYIFCGSITP
ncbi:hypothetical protein, partial [Phormidesmis priestleyi]